MTETIELHKAEARFHTDLGWLDSRHSFSFGGHYDPSNVGHGLLLVSNDDRVAAGGGFGSHAHQNMEIVTWVLSGELEHRDSAGHAGILRPGLAQRMSAGRGIRHSERNRSRTEPVHFIQMWVPPDVTGIDPGYEQLDVSELLGSGGLVPVASGRGHRGAITIHQAGAVMYVARLEAADSVSVPDAPFVHVFVAAGAASMGAESLGEGDAIRLTNAGAQTLSTAGAAGAAEIIVWEFDREASR